MPLTVREVTCESEALLVGDAVLAIKVVAGRASNGGVGRAGRGTDSERVAAGLADVTDRERSGGASRQALPVPEVSALAGESSICVAGERVRVYARRADVVLVVAVVPRGAGIDAGGLVKVFGRAIESERSSSWSARRVKRARGISIWRTS